MMRLALVAVSLCVTLASSTALAASPAPAAAPALSLEQVLARNLEARGGAAKIAALRSLRLTGRVITGSGDDPTEAAFGQLQSRPANLRAEFTKQGLTSVSGYDSREGWALDPFNGRRDAQRLSVDDARGLSQAADLEGPLVNWAQKGHRVELLGTEDVDGTEAYKLRVALKDGDVLFVYLDPDYFLEIRIDAVRHLRGTERITETDLGSYEQVGGGLDSLLD